MHIWKCSLGLQMQKVSIITTSFNSESTILDTLNSVNNQTYKNIEHIIIDGASKDNTLQIVNDNGLRIKKLISKKDKGIYDAYNKGLDIASGDIVAFLNSDDFYYDNFVIEKIMGIFKDKSIDACYGDLIYVERNNTNKITRYWKSKDYKNNLFKKGFSPAHPTLFLRRSVYQKAGNFNLSYRLAADYEFMLRIFNNIDIKSKYIPEILVRMRNGGATGESIRSILLQNKEILKAHKEHKVKISYLNFFAQKFINRILQRFKKN
jgi:glycosyltransferase involved in cell wall biosynthesis